jgi:hypothetical protein
MTVDAFTVSANDTLACTTQDTTITGAVAKAITISGTLTSTGAASHPVTWTQYMAFTLANATTQTATYTTFTGTNGFDWNDGCDLTINTGCSMQCGVCTLTNSKIGLQATSGWLVQKDASSNFTQCGVMSSSESPSAGWRANDVTGNFATTNATYYSSLFLSSYTLGANMVNVDALTVCANTTMDTKSGSNYTLTCSGDAIVGGTLYGRASAVTVWSMAISVGGTYSATSATTTISGEDASLIAWHNDGTFTANGGKVDMLGCTSPYKIMGDNTWDTLEITESTACEYDFEAGKTQTVNVYCHLNGAAGQILTLKSTNTTVADWNLTLGGSCVQDFAYLDVNDSDASGGLECSASFSTGTGVLNQNWVFGAAGEFIWDGGGVGALASTAANWEGDAAPGVGSDVQFSIPATKSCTWDIASTGAGHV